MNPTQSPLNSFQRIDVNSPNFYNNVQDQIDIDLARLKKNVSIDRNLRITAAEMEVETAALYHAELWSEIENLKLIINQKNTESSKEN
ncbi:unnamed protein product [Parnassius apollo]|uniref:(apollo) hypothetical protein n=1 Tax=Parnassius apollo TaxID=110799 RepID=A0A8S3WD15_PARAO|nr:unnamed protein product [Parnassius apollo]